MPTISVVIPVYNVERYLRRCLDSVMQQTFSDWEAVCVNDGSSDGSRAILQEFADRDSRFRIIDKENGGVSDARNVGVANALGEYVIFLDSDDLIHPQTMEISYALSQRDGSDIVSWYKDKLFRPELLIRSKIGMNIDSVIPRNISKRYRVEDVPYYITDDPFAHVTEGSTKGISHPIKHFYVWCFLLRRSLVEQVKFVKGLIFEDFPWWSEVLLRNPRITITRLPFYYYFPNFKSIDLSSKRADKVRNWIKGLEYSWLLYQERASDYQKTMWMERCFWPVVRFHIVRNLSQISDNAIERDAKERLLRLWESGAFATPPNRQFRHDQIVLGVYLEKSC